MDIYWSPSALRDYHYWKINDEKKTEKIKDLLRNIQESPYQGLGKPEALKYDKRGLWSRRINLEHRLVYYISERGIEVVSCRYHYE